MKPNGQRDRVEWKPKGSVKRKLSKIVKAGNANTVKSQALFLLKLVAATCVLVTKNIYTLEYHSVCPTEIDTLE
jgi:hypothetical protein